MKPKNLILAVVIVALVGLGPWWSTQPTATIPVKTAEVAAPAPVMVEAPKQVAPPTIAAPIAPPVAQPAPAPQPVAADLAIDGAQAELNAAFDDIATMIQAGDFEGVSEKYATPTALAKIEQIPQERQAAKKQAMQQMMSSPQGQQMKQVMTQKFQSLKNQTPEMNASGDEATYQLKATADLLPPGTAIPPPRPIGFVKIDGRWYAKNSDDLP